MLVKHKIIIIFIIVFILGLDISALFFVNESSKLLYEYEYKIAEAQHQFIVKNINDTITNLKNSNQNITKEVLSEVINMYQVFYKLDGVELYLLNEDSLTDIYYPIHSIEFTSILSSNDFRVIYIKDIQGLYDIQNEWKKLFTFINLSIITTSSLVLFLLLKKVTKPLDKILDKIATIKKGDFSDRIEIDTKDEFGQLAFEFNEMAKYLQLNIAKLQETIEDKQVLAENMAHELRNPLTSIKGFSEYLLKANVNKEDTKVALQHINSETIRLQNLCNKILNLSLIKHEQIKLKCIDIDCLISDIKKITFEKLKNKSIKLNIENKSQYIYADKELLLSLISNLIDNSINASENNKEISLKFYNTNTLSYIEVSDNGCGMEEKYIKKIFEPFFRIDKVRSRDNGGAGLGLALCLSILNLHNGDMKIESAKDKGTTITIILRHFNNSSKLP